MSIKQAQTIVNEVKGQALSVDALTEKAVTLAGALLEAAQVQQSGEEKQQAAKIEGRMRDPLGKVMTTALADQAFRSHAPARITTKSVTSSTATACPATLPTGSRPR